MSGSTFQILTFIADISPLLEDHNYKKVYGLLPDFRREKADRLHFQTDKAQSAGAWRLWMLAKKYCHENGMDKEALNFNLSHSGRYVLCSAAPAGEKVGCDVETIKEFREPLARRFFCPNEYADIMAQNAALRRERFYRYWVLKESFMKATRQGMAMGLDSFEINLNGEGAENPVLDRQPADVQEKYYFKEYEARGARVAVCSTCEHFAEKMEIVSELL